MGNLKKHLKLMWLAFVLACTVAAMGGLLSSALVTAFGRVLS